jgi:hypothetical protein
LLIAVIRCSGHLSPSKGAFLPPFHHHHLYVWTQRLSDIDTCLSCFVDECSINYFGFSNSLEVIQPHMWKYQRCPVINRNCVSQYFIHQKAMFVEHGHKCLGEWPCQEPKKT